MEAGVYLGKPVGGKKTGPCVEVALGAPGGETGAKVEFHASVIGTDRVACICANGGEDTR